MTTRRDVPGLNPEFLQDLLTQSRDYSVSYLNEIVDRRVSVDPDATAAVNAFDEPLPVQPGDPSETLEMMHRLGSPATLAMVGPRFFGFVIGGALPVSLAANWLAGAWDQSTSYFATSPGPAEIEQTALNWTLDVLGLPDDCGGAFVTGATMANFSGLAAARHRVLERAGWDVEANGLCGAPPVTIILGEEAHPTVFKSLGLLGFGRSTPVRVAVDGQGRIRPEAIPRNIEGPAIICVQAGNVNTGAFDPMDAVCEAAAEINAWVHVDGAFGLWAGASDSLVHLTRGMEKADSWATDAHKWLNVPYDCGVVMVRDRDALRAAMSVTASYLPEESGHRNPSDYTPELSRRARGVEVWSVLRTLGRQGLALMIDDCCRHARRFAEALAAAGYEINNDVVLNQVLVDFGGDEKTAEVIDAIQQDGTCWCGVTRWRGKTLMRISVSSWATTDDDVEQSIEAMVRLAKGC